MTMDPRKVPGHQQLQDQISVPAVVLLSSLGKRPNRFGVSDPDLISQFLEQLFEPGRIATGFKPDNHLFTGKLLVEATYFTRCFMAQPQLFYCSIFGCQITDRLLARMKVDPDIYCHRRLLLLTQICNRQSNNSRQETPASYHQP